MVQKRKKNPRLPFGRQRESFPRPARLCYPWLPSSVSRLGGLGGLWWDPGSQAPARSAGRALHSRPMATGLLREDRTPGAQTRVQHAGSAPHALFPFSASGIGLFSRRAESQWPGGPRVLRKPELPATSSARRGGGEPSKLPRRRAERIPEEKPLC